MRHRYLTGQARSEARLDPLRQLQVLADLNMPGSLGHLAARFFDYLGSRPLDENQKATIVGRLSPAETDLFFAQSVPDQAHGFHAASVVANAADADPEVVRAAALHDVGKRHSGLGVIGRVVASVLIKLRLPLTKKMRAYRDHGELGAVDLEAIGAPSLTVDFARHHHGKRPPSIEPGVWELLQSADTAPKRPLRRTASIT